MEFGLKLQDGHKMTAGYADFGGEKLYYEIEGKGEILVLIHVGFVDSRMWNGQWEAFTQHYRVLRFDMRGFGKSDPATGPVSRRQDLYRLLQELGIKHAHLLGCSLGGETAIDFTLEHPELVRSLIVVSAAPGGFEMRGDPPALLLEMLQALEQGDLARVSDLQIRLWVDGSFRQPEQVDSRVRQRATEMNRIPVENGTWAIADANPLSPLVPPAAGRLGNISIPVLVVAGALDNPEILRAADLLANEVEGAEKVIIPDTAHLPNMEKPAEFNHIVLDFLNRL